MINYKLDYSASQRHIGMLNEDEKVHINTFKDGSFDISLTTEGFINLLSFVKSEKNDTYNNKGDRIIPLFYRRGDSGISPYICAAAGQNIYHAHTLKTIKNESCTSIIGKEFGVYCEGALLAKGYIDYKERLLGVEIFNKEQYSMGDLEVLKFIIFLWVYKCALTIVDRVE